MTATMLCAMPTRVLQPLLSVALALCPLAAQFRLVPTQPEEPAPAVHLPGSFDDALAAAKQRDTLMLLFFTASW